MAEVVASKPEMVGFFVLNSVVPKLFERIAHFSCAADVGSERMMILIKERQIFCGNQNNSSRAKIIDPKSKK